MQQLTTEEYEAKAVARFWRKVDKSAGCWIWTGTRTHQDYGRFFLTYPDGKKCQVSAHRFAWADVNGPIPDGIEIDHACHTPLCVNPGHLRAATRKQNSENRQGPTCRNKSGVRGVFWHANRWVAKLGHNKKQVMVGRFLTLEEAEAAIVAKRLELFTHNVVDRASR